MEFNKLEVNAVQSAANEKEDGNFQEISDLELALVSGGSGDITLG